MADNTTILPLNPDNFAFETYSSQDENLLNVNLTSSVFDPFTDYIEFYVYDLSDQIIRSNKNFTGYTIEDNQLYLNPEVNTIDSGIDIGIVNILYNFYTPQLSSSIENLTYYIEEISSDRTEIRLNSTNISSEDIIISTDEFITFRNSQESFPDFYLNFDNNQLVIANNIKLDGETVLIKLYESLPSNFGIKDALNVVTKISEGLAYQIDFSSVLSTSTSNLNFISGPNFNLNQLNQLNNSSEYNNIQSYTSASVTSSQYQINSLFNTPGVNINIDYTDFSNFVNFSSATERLNNFYYKAGLIESASNQLDTLSSITPVTSNVISTQNTLKTLIDETITNFDGYEYYLYFESGSSAWPKSNSTYPYVNVSTGSSEAQTWMTSSLVTSSNYDNSNSNYLYYSIPEYIRDDSSNQQYLTFLDMVGQFFDDNVWVYIKDITQKYNADNRLNYGVSKDLVAQILRDFGIKLYQSNYGTSDLFTAFLGATEDGSLFPYPNITSSLPTPSGYEYIDTFVSASNEVVPLNDIQKRIYKRIYHNLPYLLKTKGTVKSIRTLANIFGIPDTILQINEFGGKDEINVNDWDLWDHQFNYASQMRSTNYISSSFQLSPEWGSLNDIPSSVQFRFNVGKAINAPTSQSLWSLDDGSQVKLVLEYDTTLPTTSGSYSGSIIDPEYQYANLKFTVDDFTTSSSIRLPFYNNDWWSVQINRDTDVNFEVLAANSIYSGSDGSQLGFIASSSVTTGDASNWDNGLVSWFSSENGGGIPLYNNFTGLYQEIRYFNQAISQSVFKDYTMNPQSTEGNGTNGSYDQLAFRASLGGELYTGSISIHPKISGSYIQNSFQGDTSNFTILNTSFEPNKEWIFYDSPAVGIKNRNTDKIKQEDLVLPTGDTLSNINSIQQKSYTKDLYTPNINLLEVAFSPQNQINDDIISQIGFFNIGDYIGDPRLISSSSDTYPSLDELRDEYFSKYIKNYDVNDFINLIKYFDNSFFKTVKDFIPARTSLASGIVIKQHLLERQKYPTPQAEWDQPEYTGSIGSIATLVDGTRQYDASGEFDSIPIETISGSNGGTIITTNVTQSWTGIYDTPLGQVEFTQDDEVEFYDGEFSGSALLVSDGELNSENTLKKPTTTPLVYDINVGYFEGGDVDFSYATPSSGEAYWNGEINNIPRGTSFVRNVEVFSIDIHQIDKSGTNLQDVLNSISEGTEITFRAKGRFQNFPGPGDTTLDTTFTANIATSFGIGNDSFRLILETPATLGTLSFTPLTLTSTLISNFDVIIDPLVQGGFTYSEDNAIINNVLTNDVSTIFYDLDYSSNAIQAVNQQIIISSSQQGVPGASFAEVQDYNYYTKRSTLPRYKGSKNTVASFNTGSEFTSQVSAGTYVAYYSRLIASGGGPGNFLGTMVIEYIIAPDGTLIEAINNEDNRILLAQNFADNVYSEGQTQMIATPISSSDTTIINFDYGIEANSKSTLQLEGRRDSSSYTNDNNGGIIYPLGIELTSAKDLPQQAREILSRNNII